MDLDKKSKELFSKFLREHQYTDIKDTDEISQYYTFDILANRDGKKYAFELKDRNCKSTSYGDILCEKHKYDVAVNKINSGEYDAVFVVNFYTDGVFAICHIYLGKEKLMFCPKTTSFKNREYEQKKMWLMPQKQIFEYDRE